MSVLAAIQRDPLRAYFIAGAIIGVISMLFVFWFDEDPPSTDISGFCGDIMLFLCGAAIIGFFWPLAVVQCILNFRFKKTR